MGINHFIDNIKIEIGDNVAVCYVDETELNPQREVCDAVSYALQYGMTHNYIVTSKNELPTITTKLKKGVNK